MLHEPESATELVTNSAQIIILNEHLWCLSGLATGIPYPTRNLFARTQQGPSK